MSQCGADVLVLSRSADPEDKRKALEGLGIMVRTVDMSTVFDIASACEGAACVVSALQGLRDVIIDMQSVLLEGAVKSNVKRFIPSDFSTDFRSLPPRENRNYDLRRDFHARLDAAPIAPTSIYSGVFAEVLMQNPPYLNFDTKVVAYWEVPDWRFELHHDGRYGSIYGSCGP